MLIDYIYINFYQKPKNISYNKIMYTEKMNFMINSSEMYCEMSNIANIIKACSLVPGIKKFSKTNIVKKWHDAYGLSLNLQKSKSPVINRYEVKNEIDIDKYSGLSLDNCIKITNKICIISGLDDCTNTRFKYYNCYCIDDKIRSYFLYDNKIKKCSSLYLDYSILSSFINFKSGHIKIKSKILNLCNDEVLIMDTYPLSKKIDF